MLLNANAPACRLGALVFSLAASFGAAAAVPFEAAPVDYAGPVTFGDAVAANIRLVSGTASIIAGAGLDGYFWGTGFSATEWRGGTIASYLQADQGASITVVGSGLTISEVGPWFGGTKYTITGNLLSGDAVQIDAYTYSGGSLHVANVPEPPAVAMVLSGLLLVAGLARRAGIHPRP